MIAIYPLTLLASFLSDGASKALRMYFKCTTWGTGWMVGTVLGNIISLVFNFNHYREFATYDSGFYFVSFVAAFMFIGGGIWDLIEALTIRTGIHRFSLVITGSVYLAFGIIVGWQAHLYVIF